MNLKQIIKQFLKSFQADRPVKENIHEQLKQTIAERKRILPQWEQLFLSDSNPAVNDIHFQLKQTIKDLKKIKSNYSDFYQPGHFILNAKNAA